MKALFNYLLAIVFVFGITTTSYSSNNKGDDKKVLSERSFPISAGKKLVVNAESGDVQVTPWDKSEVYVKVIGNENAEKKFDFSYDASSEEVKIKAERKGSWSWFSNISLKFEIKVPSNFNIYANTSGGDIKIGGIKGGITLKTSGGDIWGDRFEGSFDAKTSGGDINLFCSNAKIDVSTSGGDIELEYTGKNKGVELNTSGGDIDIKVPQNFDANVDLRTSGGDIDCNINLNNVKKLSETKVIGSLNNGGVPLTAHTSGGDITVKSK